jgi:hypothetical protein
MVHRHHAIALDHSVVGREVLLRDGGVVGRRVCELLAHELRHPVAVLVGAACDAGDNERHCGVGDMGMRFGRMGMFAVGLKSVLFILAYRKGGCSCLKIVWSFRRL